MGCLRRPLPITFRINGSGRFSTELRDQLETNFFARFSDGPVIVGPPRCACAGCCSARAGGAAAPRPAGRRAGAGASSQPPRHRQPGNSQAREPAGGQVATRPGSQRARP